MCTSTVPLALKTLKSPSNWALLAKIIPVISAARTWASSPPCLASAQSPFFHLRTSISPAVLRPAIAPSAPPPTMHPCFTAPISAPSLSPFLAPALACPLPAAGARSAPAAPRAQADLPPPGIPSGQDPLNGAPLRHYVTRPLETYDDRSFATILPRTWEGETTTIGVSDVEPVTKEQLEEARKVPVDAASTGAFVEFAAMMKDEREQQLAEQARRNALPKEGRPTCGKEEGTSLVSNYQPILIDGVKCVEYWGVPNGPVPRLFGGPGS